MAQLHFEGASGEKLAAGLDRDFSWTLSHLLFAFREGPADVMLTRGSDWAFLVPVILDGIKTNPDVIGLSIVHAFFESGSPDVQLTSLDFRTNDVRDYFGEKSDEFYSLIANINPLVFPDTQQAEFMGYVASCAKKHMKHDGS